MCGTRSPHSLARVYVLEGVDLLVMAVASHRSKVDGVPTNRANLRIPALLSELPDEQLGYLLRCPCSRIAVDTATVTTISAARRQNLRRIAM